MATYSNGLHRWLQPFRAWQTMQRRVLALGSCSEPERNAALDWFIARGSESLPQLRHALRGSPGVACGAALALYRQGDAGGLRTVLLRCYDEQWLQRCLQDGHLAELNALRRFGRGTMGAVLMAALDDAAREGDGHACLEALTVSLSAMRVLAIFDDVSPQNWWERALRFGPTSLRGLGDGAARSLANNITAWIRNEATSHLLLEHRDACAGLLIDALQSDDRAIATTAIDGMLKLKDRRTLPYLYAIAFGKGHALAAHARRAIEHIEGRQADALMLMRAAQQPETAETLLRAAAGHAENREQGTLLRTVT